MLKKINKKPVLDIVINSYNVRDLVLDCLASVYKQKGASDNWRVILADMASTDNTVEAARKKFPQAVVLASPDDLGFAKGNNYARSTVTAEYVLFLNPDTVVVDHVIQNTLRLLQSKKDCAAIGCRVMLSNGRLDYSCHRGLPTVWNSICYWTGLSKMFPHSPKFAGYEATHLDYYKSHYIDCITGAYLMIKKTVLDKINWWDEDFFWNGEDIEMCYQIKKHGYKIWYDSDDTIIHYKGSSSGLYDTARVKVPKKESIKLAKSATRAMRIFIRKHWSELGPAPLVLFAWLGILVLEKIRLAKIQLGLRYG